MELGQKGDPGAVEHCHQALEQVTWKPERTQELLTQAGLGGGGLPRHLLVTRSTILRGTQAEAEGGHLKAEPGGQNGPP